MVYCFLFGIIWNFINLFNSLKMEGWIKLHRSCLDHWLYTEYRPLTRREAWETILFTVNFEPSKLIIKGQLYLCDRGQSLLSLQSWAEKFVWSIQQVRTFFKLLENDQMISLEGLQYTTRLTVCNYAIYQDQQQTANTPLTDGQQTANTPLTTIKEEEELKKNKNKSIGEKSTRFIPPTPEEVKLYCLERKNDVDPIRWFNFYNAKNWMIGKNKMKNWKSAVATWETNQKTNLSENNRQNTSITRSDLTKLYKKID